MYNTTLKLIKSKLHFSKICKFKKLNEIEYQNLNNIKTIENKIKDDKKILSKYQKKKDAEQCDILKQSINGELIKINDLKQKIQSNKIKKDKVSNIIKIYTNYQNLRTNFLKEKRDQFVIDSRF
jgi:hypothetical protein